MEKLSGVISRHVRAMAFVKDSAGANNEKDIHMRIPKKVKDIFTNEPIHQLATSSIAGIPNVASVGAVYLLDDETILVVDNYMKKTLANIVENPQVAFLIRSGKESYQIKGRCEYLTSGLLYEEAKKWMKLKGEKYPAKGAVKITVEEIFNSAGGPCSGEKIMGEAIKVK